MTLDAFDKSENRRPFPIWRHESMPPSWRWLERKKRAGPTPVRSASLPQVPLKPFGTKYCGSSAPREGRSSLDRLNLIQTVLLPGKQGLTSDFKIRWQPEMEVRSAIQRIAVETGVATAIEESRRNFARAGC